jgi:hypothetical protein
VIAHVIAELRAEWRRDIQRLERNGRRVLVAPALMSATAAGKIITALASQRDALRRELAETRRSRDEARGALTDLLNAVDERWRAEAKVARLERERSLAREMGRPPAHTVH